MDQRAIKSLLNTEAYPDLTECVRLVQTHISYLFLTDKYVYKIKKPVDFGFLNFTTLELRRFYCHEEVRLNRRLCPDVYLGVAEVRESPSGATLRDGGKVIDYAVKMRRLPESLMLDRMLAEDSVTEADIRNVARIIASFHLRAERGGGTDEYGSSANIRSICEDNFDQLAELASLAGRRKDLGMLRHWVNSFISAKEALFAERVARGFIRDCDGDLHLENICMTSPVCIFDCIEFNNRFRHIDTASDIAFFLMDLDFHGKSVFSRIFLDEYIARTGDAGAAELLDFYRINRAVVRCKVESLKLLDANITESDKKVAEEKALRYIRLARGYVFRRGRLPALFITCGLTGSGKSFIASALAFELGLRVLSSDAVRKELADITEGGRCRDEYGKGIYTPSYNDATYHEMLERCRALLRAGNSVIADATFRRKGDRAMFASLASLMGMPFYILLIHCPEDLARQRLDERNRDPAALSDGRWGIYHLQRDEFEPADSSEGKIIPLDTSLPLDDNIYEIIQAMEMIGEAQTFEKDAWLSEP